MNIPSQFTLYDMLCMLVPGFVIMWFFNFFGLHFDKPLECFFIVTLSYPIGMVYHRIIEYVFNYTKKCWELKIIQKAWIEENNKLDERNTRLSKEIRKNDYCQAYYKVARNGCLLNIPILEAQEAFLRNAILLIILSIFKVCCCYCDTDWHCKVIMLLVILSIATVFAWYFTQRKIMCLVWEADLYLSN